MKPKTAKRATPNQERSQKTVERVLEAAADLLEEVGFEGLSTNLICKRAGLTPPALYRYFPNKYAVLKELGQRLMERQNTILEAWQPDAVDLDTVADQYERFIRDTLEVTRATKAGGWIMRSMHATPVLADVRVDSHRRMAQQSADLAVKFWPDLDPAAAYANARLGIETGYAVIEMIFDEPEVDVEAAINLTASMLAHNLRMLVATLD